MRRATDEGDEFPAPARTPEAREAIAGNFAALLIRGVAAGDAIEYVFARVAHDGMAPDTDEARAEAAGVLTELATRLAELMQEVAGQGAEGGAPDARR